MPQILSQADMQRARSRLSFCYLCGKSLPRGAERRAQIMDEHVIPKSVLGPAPSDGAWPIVLTVHRECDNAHKGGGDDVLSLLHKINTKPRDEWPSAGDLSRLQLTPVRVVHPATGQSLPAFQGVNRALTAVSSWVRGIHSALYGEYLAPETKQLVLPPVPAMDSTNPALSMKELEEDSTAIRSVLLRAAMPKNRWDGIVAWGGLVGFAATWALNEYGEATCMWILSHPGVADWSASVVGDADCRPWHGVYHAPTLPPGATVLHPDA